jgi:hypothetical protein
MQPFSSAACARPTADVSPPCLPAPLFLQAYTPQVPTFALTIERGGSRLTLRVPLTFNTKLRLDRLHTFLRKEKWAVGAMAPLAAGLGGQTDRQALAEELLFVRDCLGPLRTRPGAVPEKVRSLQQPFLLMAACDWT